MKKIVKNVVKFIFRMLIQPVAIWFGGTSKNSFKGRFFVSMFNLFFITLTLAGAEIVNTYVERGSEKTAQIVPLILLGYLFLHSLNIFSIKGSKKVANSNVSKSSARKIRAPKEETKKVIQYVYVTPERGFSGTSQTSF